ncbi:MAG TPA: UbiH/UbiF/VisC/COQ6 family ubiquinone biosynthesis hydroxylase [Gammaproteobacteria bacterium]|nr:UbiH/UbiF/VisC/COQ6 family ubiquinone biosynthesis hydroxylase [Gammaproteobacteria bacterium]
MKSFYDIIVVGGGVVGSVAALALAQKSSLKIALIESQTLSFSFKPDQHDHRVSAISLASKRILQNIAVWSAIESKRVASYTRMSVCDEKSTGKLEFDCNEVALPVLGYIIEDSVMRASLLQKIAETASIDLFCPAKMISLKKNADGVLLEMQDGNFLSTKLLIAADGAHSFVRQQANMELNQRDYGQTAIVATIRLESSHEKTAWQRFLTTGPLAFLPLEDNHLCSIVWSVTEDCVNELLSLDDEFFSKKLTEASEKKWGEVTVVSPRYHFPLRMRHAKKYVEERIALIGDAAHTLHPLAGQGVNLGLLDAACLSDVILEAIKKNRDFSSLPTLRRYERWRKSDNLAMLAMVDVLKNCFGEQSLFINHLRGTGLNCINRFDFIKNRLIQYAVGNRGDLPGLARE